MPRTDLDDRLFWLANEKEIRNAETTDSYFLQTKRVLQKNHIDARVVMEVYARDVPYPDNWGIVSGIYEVAKLLEGLPTKPYHEFTKCPAEDLRNPGRVHVDCYGNIHLCQGLCMGNLWATPLAEMVKGYDPDAHPIAGPMLRGGPALLAEEYGVTLIPKRLFSKVLAARDCTIDGIHLSQTGQYRMAATISDLLGRVFPSSRISSEGRRP
jgi:hypothetical protein